jgi:hypothetical protein
MSQFSWTEERSFVLARHGSSYAALCCCPADAGRMAVVRACFFLMLGFVTFQPPLLRAEEGVAPAARDLGRAVRDAGKAVGQGAKHVGRQTKGPAREVGHGFRDGAIAVGHGFRDGFGKGGAGNGGSAARSRSVRLRTGTATPKKARTKAPAPSAVQTDPVTPAAKPAGSSSH